MRLLKVSALMVLFLFGAVLLLGVVSLRASPRGGGVFPSGNGDVNCDGKIDISDPIHLLAWLFTGGPAPMTCADSPELIAGIAALNSSIQDLNQAIKDLKAVPCKDDPARFVDNGNGTVTDRCTGLMWLQRTEDVNGDGTFDPTVDAVSWTQAKSFVEELQFAEHSDWRLPTITELEGLVIGGPSSPGRVFVFDPVFTLYPAAHWSSTLFLLQERSAWTLGFGPPTSADGLNSPVRDDIKRFVLAVRSDR